MISSAFLDGLEVAPDALSSGRAEFQACQASERHTGQSGEACPQPLNQSTVAVADCSKFDNAAISG